MLAALTLTISLGWWILPAVITAILGVIVIREEAGSTGMLSGLGYILMAVPILFVWCLYLLAALLFGIR